MLPLYFKFTRIVCEPYSRVYVVFRFTCMKISRSLIIQYYPSFDCFNYHILHADRGEHNSRMRQHHEKPCT